MSTSNSFFLPYDPWYGNTLQGNEILTVEVPTQGLSAGFNTITLTTLINNTITGAHLNSGAIVLPPGYYDVFCSISTNRTDITRAYLYNKIFNVNTMPTIAIYNQSSDLNRRPMTYMCRKTWNPTIYLELRVYAQTTRATDGLNGGTIRFARVGPIVP